jgi:hypothetical protein
MILWGRPTPTSAYHAYRDGVIICGVHRPTPEVCIAELPARAQACITCRWKAGREERRVRLEAVRQREREIADLLSKERADGRRRTPRGRWYRTRTHGTRGRPKKMPDLSVAQIEAILAKMDAKNRLRQFSDGHQDAWSKPR